MNIEAEFIRSASAAADLPRDSLGEVALVGRSNVGKSSLINALVRQRLARASAAPGKTRLANIYRVARPGARALYLVDLPGYGYARGGFQSAREFEELTQAYFGRARQVGLVGQVGPLPTLPAAPAQMSALLLVDSRHPGLDSDLAAWQWLRRLDASTAIVATKIDKLSRAERTRALGQLETVFEDSVLPFSAVTGEGLDELWKLIDRLVNSPKPQRHSSNPAETAPPRPPRKPPRARRK